MLEILFEIGDSLELLANLAIVITVAKWAWSFRRVTIQLSCGEISLRQRDINIQNLTNMVSKKFYQGGMIPPTVRAEIMEVTLPKFW